MPKITSQKRDARCQQILDAAGRCFAREGFHRTSMEHIVRESKISPGAIYCYFRSKNEIVAAIADQRHRQESTLLAKLLGPGSISDRLRQLTHDFLNLLRDPDERHRRKVTIQIWSESLRDMEIRKIVNRGLRQREALSLSLLRTQQSGELRSDLDPDSLSRVMLALLQGFILQQAWEPELDSAKFFETALYLINRSVTTPCAKATRGNCKRSADAQKR